MKKAIITVFGVFGILATICYVISIGAVLTCFIAASDTDESNDNSSMFDED